MDKFVWHPKRWVNGFLLKPIVMKDLSHKIRDLLDENSEVPT